MSNIILKISWKDDIRRFPVPAGGISYKDLQNAVSQMFDLAQFRLKYIDEDQELITVSSDRELNEAIAYLREQDPRKIVRFFVRTPEDASTDVTASIANMNLASTLFSQSAISSGYNRHFPSPYSNNPTNPNIPSLYPTPYNPNGPGVYMGLDPRGEQPHGEQPVYPKSGDLPNEYSHRPQQPALQPVQPPVQPVQPVQPPVQPVQPPVQPQFNPANPPIVSVPKGPDGSFSCHFEGDKQIPDGTVVKPGSKFTKIWLVKNSGDKKWPAGTVLEWILGDKMDMKTQIPVPEAVPGEVVEIPLDITAPTREGKYTSHFRFNLPNGKPFGHRVWVDIEVRK